MGGGGVRAYIGNVIIAKEVNKRSLAVVAETCCAAHFLVPGDLEI